MKKEKKDSRGSVYPRKKEKRRWKKKKKKKKGKEKKKTFPTVFLGEGHKPISETGLSED